MKKPIFNLISANRPKFLNHPILDDSKKLIIRSKVSYFSACTLCTNVNGVNKNNRPNKFPYLDLVGPKNHFFDFYTFCKDPFKTFFAVSVQTHE
jgi:hypothetical protein